MDENDRKVLQELVRDGRAKISEIAERIGLSRQTVSRKIDELEGEGIIRSFTAELDSEMIRMEERAYIIVTADPRKELRKKFIQEIKDVREIRQIHYTFGRFDLVLEVLTTDEKRLNEVIDHIHEFEAVKDTETLICREAVKKESKGPFLKALKG